MATISLGQVRPVYRGNWNTTDTYNIYDWVSYMGSAWLALQNTPANYEPDAQPTHWVLFGAKGDSGNDGAQGAVGPKGEQGAQGIPGPSTPLSNSINSTSETTAATSYAVKTAHDLAQSASQKYELVKNAYLKNTTDNRTLSSLGMPSGRSINLTLPASGGTVTAPANGYILFRKRAGGLNLYIALEGGGLRHGDLSSMDRQTLIAILPVRSGASVLVEYTAILETVAFCFVYAEGN